MKKTADFVTNKVILTTDFLDNSTRPGHSVMTDLDIIEQIEVQLGVSLKRQHSISGFEQSYTQNQQGRVDGLGLYKCGISDLNSLMPLLTALPHIRELDLSSNQISDITSLEGLTRLDSLYLSNNQISDISCLQGMTLLHTLYLAANQIEDISSLSGHIQLQTLNLAHNQISDLTALQHFNRIKLANLTDNKIEHLPTWITRFNTAISRKHITEKGNISLYQNPIRTPPIEIVEEGNAAISNYFAQLQSQGTAFINEAKLMLVGEPGAGKTTLMNKLFNRDFMVPNKTQRSTLGIEVRQNWVFNDEKNNEFKAHIWDFGGQQIQHMLHQFFLTPDCVYVLMAEKRRELTNFDYWLNIINLLGKNSPVVILFNEINFDAYTSFIYDEKKYKDLFSDQDLQRLDVNFADTEDGRFDMLLKTVKNKLSRLDHMGKEVPAKWLDIRQALEQQEQQKHIRIGEYFAICEQFEVNKEADQMLILRYFHLLGIVLHFSDDENLCDTLFLDPNWTVDAVYSVLASKDIERCNGIIDKSSIDAIWSAKGYDFEERAKLLQLMLKDNFELCYKLTTSADRYIVPSLLSPKKPDYPWDEENNLHFRFQYPFMPKGIVSRLVVRMHQYVSQDMLYKEGAVFIKSGAQAEVIERKTIKEGLKIVAIRLNGQAGERKDLLTLIREEIKKIQISSFPNLPYIEMVPCCCSECVNDPNPYFFDHNDIDNYQQKGKASIDCRKSTESVPILTLVGSVFNTDEIESRAQTLADDKNIQINFNPQVNVQQQATLLANQQQSQNQSQSQTASMDIQNLQGLFRNLKEDIVDEIEIELDDDKEVKRINNDLKKVENAFNALEQATLTDQTELDSATRGRITEFVDNLCDQDSRLNRALMFVARGKEKMQSLGRAYNQFAPHFALNSIPPVLLGEELEDDDDDEYERRRRPRRRIPR